MTENPQEYDPTNQEPTAPEPEPAAETPSEGTEHAAVPPAAVPETQGEGMPDPRPGDVPHIPVTPAPIKLCCATCVYAAPTVPDPRYGYNRVICKYMPPSLFAVEQVPTKRKPGKLLRREPAESGEFQDREQSTRHARRGDLRAMV